MSHVHIFLFSRMFEAHMQSYKGDDPLSVWQRLAFSLYLFPLNRFLCCFEN